jgi:uroporphyrinogen-III synthase
MAKPSFQRLRVLALESRRAKEIAALITSFGGEPIVAPALREIPIASNPEALAFGASLLAQAFDVVVCLTGVGTRALVDILDSTYAHDAIVAALGRTRVVARGPKPLAVLRDLGVPVWLTAPEPNTWRELVAAFEAKRAELPPRPRIAVQEYGVSNPELIDALRAAGADVTRVPVYRWALPEDLAPLVDAVHRLDRGEIDVVLFTTSMQIVHLAEIASRERADVGRGLRHAVVASIGPTTSEELIRHGWTADLEATHPKMGILVTEAADQAAALIDAKRRRGRTIHTNGAHDLE